MLTLCRFQLKLGAISLSLSLSLLPSYLLEGPLVVVGVAVAVVATSVAIACAGQTCCSLLLYRDPSKLDRSQLPSSCLVNGKGGPHFGSAGATCKRN